MSDGAAQRDATIPPGAGPGLGLLGPRTRHLLALEFGARPSSMTRVLSGAGSSPSCSAPSRSCWSPPAAASSTAQGQISLAAAVVAPGLMVMAIILFMGAVSGAHLNPAVSLAFALRGDFPWKRVPGYIIVQLIGATLACLFLLAVFGNIQHLGATLPGPGYEDWQALLMEIVLTALLSASSSGPHRRRRTSARSPRSASAGTSRWPACGPPRSAAPR